MKVFELLLLLFVSLSSASTKCTICTFLHDYYDDSSEFRLDRRMAKNSKPRTRSVDRMEQALMNSLTRVSDLTSSLFGNLVELTNQRTASISSNDVPAPLRTRGTTPKITTKVEMNSNQGITSHLFNIFDSIGSGIMRISRLDGPHICTRERTTKRSPSNKDSLKSEKSCQRFRDANKCIDRRTDAEGTVETTRVDECCEGYQTRDIFEYGCPAESPILSMHEVLDRVNSSLWNIAENVTVENELVKNNITLFVSPEYYTESDDKRSYVLNRIVPGTYRAYDWTDGTVLKTSGGGDLVISQSEDVFGFVKSFVNCLPINSSSYRSQNGIVHLVDGDLKPASATVFSTLKSDARFSRFFALFSDSLSEVLTSNKSFTVFVPSEKVLSSLSKPFLTDIKAGHGCASSFAPSHIVESSLCSSELSRHRLKSLAGAEIDVQTQIDGGEKVTNIGRARLVDGDVFAKNGVVHIIDDILIGDEFNSWKEHLETYNPHLNDALGDVVGNVTGPITIFVPPADNNTITVTAEVAKNHIVTGEVLEDLRRASTIETDAKSVMFTGYSLRTSPLWMRISMQGLQRQLGQLGCTRIIRESVKGCRSILHFIEKPLPVITDNFDTFLEKRKDLSKFYRLWQESSLNTSLTNEKPVTVFIPSDDSFSNNEYKKLIANTKLSDAFVKRHIVDEPLCDFDIHGHPGEIRIQTHANLNGEALRLTRLGNDTFIDGAKIEVSEIVLSNGVAYLLDSIISRHYVFTQPDISRRTAVNFLNMIS